MTSTLARRFALLSRTPQSGSVLSEVLLAGPRDEPAASADPATTPPANTVNIPVSAVRIAFSHDGSTLVSAGRDGTVRVWSTNSGKPNGAPMTGHDGVVQCLSLHRDGRWLATGGADGTIRVWDLLTRKGLVTWKPFPSASVRAVAFSPDGTTLAVGVDDHVYLWNVVTESLSGPLGRDHDSPGAVCDLAYSPDGSLLAGACTKNVVRLWDPAGTRRPAGPLLHSGPALKVAFSPDGGTLASADGGSVTPVRLWSAQSGQPIRTLSGHTLPVISVRYSPDGRFLASGGADTSVLLWNADNGVLVRRVPQGAMVRDVAITPSGWTLAACTPEMIRLWDLRGV